MKLKKKDGIVDKVGIPLFTLFFGSIFILMTVYYSKDIDNKEQVDTVARKYLLKMETEGYLSSSNEALLKEELSNLGVKSVSLTGTTKSKVGYGNEIRIKVTGQLPVKTLAIKNMDTTESTNDIPVNVDLTSIAKN